MTAAGAGPTVYLDVDGVARTDADVDGAGGPVLNRRCVGLVARLVRDLGARVVVSSTWRVADCRPTLVAAGLPGGCFHPDWRTRVLPGSVDPATGAMRPAELADRGGEVSEHAARNGVLDYLVLDDVDAGRAPRARQVRPDARRGYDDADDARARALAAEWRRGRAT